MPNSVVPAAAEAMPKITRRAILSGMAALAAPIAAVAAPIVIPTPTELPVKDIGENPDLIAAYERFKEAERELTAAEEALGWIADEWRHLWPLAPEELLGCANANTYHVSEDAERDIIGRFIIRDTVDFTKRFKRRTNERLCFAVMTPNEAEDRLSYWKAKVPKGRTAKALAQNIAYREKFTKEYEQALALARRYEAETSRLREQAGVEKAKQRVSAAKIAANEARRQVSRVTAHTAEGLRMKALAIATSGFYAAILSEDNIFAEISHFIDGVLNFTAGDLS
ncbi:hypothetical protein P6U16_08660 [Rhizobium sp. 32-5/1]|uniref:hypothetical protein n=1 Tax=Rhizobium sp. 32-5/1 TaxID=3019602 RepID=UPI00240D3F60|nr:hypothetical protein [Rhizobium sp. 32-5/1]WEZ84626.1 hypothetical protein P6U16_08660 [Rhizobium sp. 32-5/1]